MKEQYYHISRNFFPLCSRSSTIVGGRSTALSMLFCVIVFLVPFQLNAQDGEDSTESYSDSAFATATDEDQNKAGKFSEEAIFRSVPDTTVARMKKEKEFAYANDPAYWVKEKKVYKKGFVDYVFDFFQSDLIRWIFYTFLASLIIFVLYRIIVVNDLFIFYSSKKNKKSFEDTTLTEIDPAIIDQKIGEAIGQKNYNAAVRYLYIKTLYALNDKKWIQFHAEATNNEYLNQMSQHKKNKEFRFLTQVYEYVWYGKFDINEQQFSVVHHNFKNFQAGI